MWDDEADYDTTDVKHPDFADMWLTYIDTLRKREKEDAGLAADLLREDEALD